MRLHWRSALILAGLAAAGASVVAQGVRPQDSDVLGALLVEVRGLRAAMEQMASAGPRVQLALGRLQLQEQRINTAIRRLESVRDNVGSAERDVMKNQTAVTQLEEWLKGADRVKDADAVREREQEVKEMKRHLASMSADLQRLQAEEALPQQQIASEQGRWSDINRGLEELERSLGRR